MTDEERFLSDLKRMPNQTWDQGSTNGQTQSLVHIQDGEVIIEKRYDAEPLADDCEQNRIFTAGDNWGEGQMVGSIPPDIFNRMLLDGTAFDEKAVHAFFRANPQFIRFEKFKP